MADGKKEKIHEIKHKALEVLEGGLRGNAAARFFSWVLIVLILLSVANLFLRGTEFFEPYEETFETIETVTIGIFTLELILGFWTADVRFPGHPRSRVRYLADFMTIVQMLAIMPFYLGLLLGDDYAYMQFAEYFELLKLLHLLKLGEIGVHYAKDRKEAKKNGPQ